MVNIDRARRTRKHFGTIRQMPSGKWQVRYTGTDGIQRVAPHTFLSKKQAEVWLARKQIEIEDQKWRPPELGKETVAIWAERWIATRVNLKPSTKADYEKKLRVYVIPRFGNTHVNKIIRADVQAWVQELVDTGAGASTVRHAIGTLSRILNEAVATGALVANPCQRISLPRLPKGKVEPLTLDQVRALANAIEYPVIKPAGHGARPIGRHHFPEYGLLVRFAAFTGLRAAEVAGLKIKALDLDKEVVRVTETLSEVRGHLYTVPPKTYQSRSVPLPEFLIEELREHLATLDDYPDGYVFRAPTGTPLRWQNFYNHHFKPAVRQAGLPESTRFHDLRHTFAAILIDQGAHPRAMMERLGHSSINVTLGTYGHLLPGLDEELTRKLNQAWSNP
jgi:integrase